MNFTLPLPRRVADIGAYAKFNDAFLLDVAQTNAPFTVDIVGKYAKPEYIYHPG